MSTENQRQTQYILFSYFHKNTTVSCEDGCMIYIHDFFHSKQQLITFANKFVKNKPVFPLAQKDSMLYGKKWNDVPLLCVQNNRFHLLASSDKIKEEDKIEKVISMLEHYKIKQTETFFDDLDQYTDNRSNQNINQKYEKEPHAMVYMIDDFTCVEEKEISNKENCIAFVTSFPNQKECLDEIEKLQDTTSSLYDKTQHTGLRCVPMRKWFWSNTYCIDYHYIMELPQYNSNVKNEHPEITKAYEGTKNVYTNPESRAMIKKYIMESEKRNLKSNKDFLKMNNEAIAHNQNEKLKVEKVETTIQKVLDFRPVHFVEDFLNKN